MSLEMIVGRSDSRFGGSGVRGDESIGVGNAALLPAGRYWGSGKGKGELASLGLPWPLPASGAIFAGPRTAVVAHTPLRASTAQGPVVTWPGLG